MRLHAGDDVARRTMGFESPDVFSAILAASAFSMIVFLAMMAVIVMMAVFVIMAVLVMIAALVMMAAWGPHLCRSS